MADGMARFFSVKAALVGLGVLVLGLAIGGYCVLRVMNEGRISIMGFLLAGTLLLGGVAAFTQAFPKGCRACQKPFTDGGSSFEPKSYDPLVAAIAQGDTHTLTALVSVPRAQPEHYASLRVAYCDQCKQVGEASVHEEEAGSNNAIKVVRRTPSSSLAPVMLGAVIDLVSRRPY